MLQIKNCKRCGKIFQSNETFDICPICKELDEKEFDKIKEYLYQHPYSNMYEVATNLDISISKIKRYLRECRLQIVEKENGFLHCECCGTSIQSGRYCDECIAKLSHGFKAAFKEKEIIAHKAKFHYVPHSYR
ncbi:MAG: hypothetical protein PWR27_2487 [Petroclostridium sp.]|uniref:hypothetical protein n=1 Tax=Petroclostridium xylanilyticum TaxID=1792311 RepID=UPI000B98ABB1|nr:hypothetical protein [Petroclostridium xylanilyticum]MBZ4647561.1 regulatory protein MerR [Clostridia bacterium]MDK2811778.1 hypothetical protein [Petroclostridium sp.]